MKRLIDEHLLLWKSKNNRKPLLVNGLRQVGKTWSISEFGKNHYDQFIYLDFDSQPELHGLFDKSKDPEKILFQLSLLRGEKIRPDKALIFFDEIQECNAALNSLKYFCESSEDYHVIGAGSYLGITLSKGASFPVGKVEMLEMKPMTFKEFLLADGQELLVDYLNKIGTIEPLPVPILETLNGLLKTYFITGGMPEVVLSWTKTQDIHSVEILQENIINAYFRDFSKYPPSAMIPKIAAIWDSIVPQLSRENRKFKYGEIKTSARAREYEGALEWLITGNYLNRVTMLDKYDLPLKVYENRKHFKIYLPDTGLLRCMSNYPASSLMNPNDATHIPFKGALAENYVLQELKAAGGNTFFYWRKNNYEMDFFTQLDERILPMEVKSGENVRSASMKFLLQDFNKGVRFSMRNLRKDGKILNIPLPLVSEWQRLVLLD